MFFDVSKIIKSLVIDARNKTKHNQIGNKLTFEVPFSVFFVPKLY